MRNQSAPKGVGAEIDRCYFPLPLLSSPPFPKPIRLVRPFSPLSRISQETQGSTQCGADDDREKGQKSEFAKTKC